MASTNEITEKLTIKDGPSRERLVDCLRYAYDRGAKLYTRFVVENDDEYVVLIEGLFHEDGSGHSFGFFGHVVDYWQDGCIRASVPASKRCVRGWIYTKSPRHGFIQFSDERLTFSLG